MAEPTESAPESSEIGEEPVNPEINPNMLRRIAREEGVRNEEDIFDLTTKEDGIQKAIQAIATTPEQTTLDLSTLELNPQEAATLDRIKDFSANVNSQFKKLSRGLIEGLEENDIFSDKIGRFIKDKKFDSPRFTIADSVRGDQILNNLGFGDKNLDADSFLLVFQLPKPMVQWWYKGGVNEWGEGAEQVGPRIYPWGLFYRRLMLAVWDELDEEHYSGKLDFTRINDIGEHSKDFYYVWRVTSSSEERFSSFAT